MTETKIYKTRNFVSKEDYKRFFDKKFDMDTEVDFETHLELYTWGINFEANEGTAFYDLAWECEELNMCGEKYNINTSSIFSMCSCGWDCDDDYSEDELHTCGETGGCIEGFEGCGETFCMEDTNMLGNTSYCIECYEKHEKRYYGQEATRCDCESDDEYSVSESGCDNLACEAPPPYENDKTWYINESGKKCKIIKK